MLKYRARGNWRLFLRISIVNMNFFCNVDEFIFYCTRNMSPIRALYKYNASAVLLPPYD